jgi:hypothetical protein
MYEYRYLSRECYLDALASIWGSKALATIWPSGGTEPSHKGLMEILSPEEVLCGSDSKHGDLDWWRVDLEGTLGRQEAMVDYEIACDHGTELDPQEIEELLHESSSYTDQEDPRLQIAFRTAYVKYLIENT